MADSSMSTVDPDTSMTTTSIVDYASSPRVRQRRRVSWAAAMASDETDLGRHESKKKTNKKAGQSGPDDDNEHHQDSGFIVEELELSPSATRRRRQQQRRRHRDRRRQDQLPVIDDDTAAELLPVTRQVGEDGIVPDTMAAENANSTMMFGSPSSTRDNAAANYQNQPCMQRQSTINGSTSETQSLRQQRYFQRIPDDHSSSGPTTTITQETVTSVGSSDQTQRTDRNRISREDMANRPTAAPSSSCPTLPLNTSVWMATSLGLLMISSVLFFVAFVTPSWGIVHVAVASPRHPGLHSSPPGGVVQSSSSLDVDVVAAASTPANVTTTITWNFGLWRCCRGDGLCLGARWPAFYSATRVFAVLALFGHALSFALIFGHTIEKLLDYDPCTMLTLFSACFATAACVIVAVAVYGSLWPASFHRMLSSSTSDASTDLGYSYFMAVVTIPLTITSGLLALVDLRSSRKAYEVRRTFADVLGDDDDDDDDVVSYVTGDVTSEIFNFNFGGGGNLREDGVAFAPINADRNCLAYLDRSSVWREGSVL